MTYPDSVRLALACALLLTGGCSSGPLLGTDPGEPPAATPAASMATIQIDTNPAGAMVQVDRGGTQQAPMLARVEVDASGRLAHPIEVDTDFSEFPIRGVPNSSSLTLRAGTRPPIRILFVRTRESGIQPQMTESLQ